MTDERRADEGASGQGATPASGGAAPADGGPAPAGAGPAPADGGAARGETAAALIRAGRELFAGRGYEGTSIRALTARAGANLGAVTYHFGSKRELYDAVLESSLEPFARTIAAAAASGGEPLDRIEAVVRAYFEFLRENPEVPKLILRELVEGRGPPPVASRMGRMAGAVVGAIREGQAEGTVRAGDPMLMALSVVSQPVYLTMAQAAVLAATGLDSADPATRRRIVEHAAAFVRAGLEEKGRVE